MASGRKECLDSGDDKDGSLTHLVHIPGTMVGMLPELSNLLKKESRHTLSIITILS